MPNILTLWILSMFFVFSCTRDRGLNSQNSTHLSSNVPASKLADTAVLDQVLDTIRIDAISYKNHIENPSNGFIKKIATPKSTLEVMYRPISYETLIGLESYDDVTYKSNHKTKAQVLSFSIKRIENWASALSNKTTCSLYLQDDSTGTKLEPIYFLSDHKLGNTEVFYGVFDRGAASQMHGNVLHLIWVENDTHQDIYFTRRILKEDFTHIQHVK